MMFLQASLNMQHVFCFADVKNAFCQSLPLSRGRPTVRRGTRARAQASGGCLIEILVLVYGTRPRPGKRRYEGGQTISQILLQVDDFIEGDPGTGPKGSAQKVQVWKVGSGLGRILRAKHPDGRRLHPDRPGEASGNPGASDAGGINSKAAGRCDSKNVGCPDRAEELPSGTKKVRASPVA